MSPGHHSRSRARALYAAYPDLEGIHYGSSMNDHAPAVALTEGAVPEHLLFHRALNDDTLIDILQHIALRLSYALR